MTDDQILYKPKRGAGAGLAQFISVVLHPVFMPLYAFLLLYAFGPNLFSGYDKRDLSSLVMMIVLNTIFFPCLFLLLLKGLGFIKSIRLRERKQRLIPLIGTMVFYFWPYLVAKNTGAPDLMLNLLLGNFWGIVLIFIATIFYKISMHAGGVGALLGFSVIAVCTASGLLPFVLISVLIAATALWARAFLHEHNTKELLTGLAAGLLAQFAAWLYLML